MVDFAKSIYVGNAKCKNAEVFKDGNVWVVLYAEGTKSKEFSSEAEAKKFAAQVGNAIPDSQINGPSAAEVREIAGRVYKTDMRGEDLARAVSFELAKKYKSFQTNSHIMDMVKEVLSKFKIGNETMHEWATSKPKNIGNAKVINSDREFFKELADDAKEHEDKDKQEVEKLVGNETYQHKLYPDKYVIIEGKNYKIVTDGKVEKSGELTDAVLYGINQTYKRVGNVASEYEILKHDPSKMHPMYKKAYEEAMKKLAREDEEFKKRFEKEYGVKAKNEASDDKFAYVMREFDEGKLKTPDGKVVTDPAQAKAIAYSESKKTENGLARARNAIKK